MPPNECLAPRTSSGFSPPRASQFVRQSSSVRLSEPKEHNLPVQHDRQRPQQRGIERVRQMDAELKRLREAPVQITSSVGKFAVRVDMSIFRPEDIQVLLSPGKMVFCAEGEVHLDQWTSVVRRFRRKVSIPEDVGTDAIATQIDGRGMLTVTALRRARA